MKQIVGGIDATLDGKKVKVFPLGDTPRRHELQALGIVFAQLNRENVRAICTAEYRPPKAGEWYLSGNPATAYTVNNDLSYPYHIARLVKTTRKYLEVIDPTT